MAAGHRLGNLHHTTSICLLNCAVSVFQTKQSCRWYIITLDVKLNFKSQCYLLPEGFKVLRVLRCGGKSAGQKFFMSVHCMSFKKANSEKSLTKKDMQGFSEKDLKTWSGKG